MKYADRKYYAELLQYYLLLNQAWLKPTFYKKPKLAGLLKNITQDKLFTADENIRNDVVESNTQ